MVWSDGRRYVDRKYGFRVAGGEDAAMLREPSAPAWSETDLLVFDRLIPSYHYLRKALVSIDFERFREIVASRYSRDQGRPAEDPVRMIKLGFLQYHDNLSDEQVVQRAKTDVAYRYFLGLSLTDKVPDSSSLCIFRGRVGVEGYRCIFQEGHCSSTTTSLGARPASAERRHPRDRRRGNPDDAGPGGPGSRQVARRG